MHAETERAQAATVRHRGKEVASAVATASELISRARSAARAGIGELAVTSAEMATAEADWAWLRPGESDEAARWRDAVSRWDALCFPYPAAHARWRLSHALLSRSGSSAEASQELRSALAAADALGAKALTQQIRELGARHSAITRRGMPSGLVARAGLSAATVNRRYLLSVLVDEPAEDLGQARRCSTGLWRR